MRHSPVPSAVVTRARGIRSAQRPRPLRRAGHRLLAAVVAVRYPVLMTVGVGLLLSPRVTTAETVIVHGDNGAEGTAPSYIGGNGEDATAFGSGVDDSEIVYGTGGDGGKPATPIPRSTSTSRTTRPAP